MSISQTGGVRRTTDLSHLLMRMKPEPHTRIVTSPVYAKALAEVLNTAIRQYEASYGKVPDQAEEPEGKPQETITRRRGLLKLV